MSVSFLACSECQMPLCCIRYVSYFLLMVDIKSTVLLHQMIAPAAWEGQSAQLQSTWSELSCTCVLRCEQTDRWGITDYCVQASPFLCSTRWDLKDSLHGTHLKNLLLLAQYMVCTNVKTGY